MTAGLTLAGIGEDELVRRLVQDLPGGKDVVAGPGDDCAVVQPPGRGWLQLLKTDCVVEGVHFLREADPSQVGWKALARVVSDIAAMGGTPMHGLVTLIAPASLQVSWVQALYAGLRRCAVKYGVSLVGGETARGAAIIVSVSMTGKVAAGRCLCRNGAKKGDVIFVTGRLGGSIRGRHLTFEPRLAEGQWLATRFRIHAMMDLSDGLARDLPRMARASGLGFVINEQDLPAGEGCTVGQAWGDGEDYELLFAVAPGTAGKLEAAWRDEFSGVPLTRIGRFVAPEEGRLPALQPGGWEHFSAPADRPEA